MTGTLELPPFVLRPGALRAADVRALLAGPVPVALDPAARAGVERAAAVVRAIAAGDEHVYGINTGFGKLAQTRIPRERLADLQRNLVLSHACGVGAPLDARTTRLAIVLKIGSLARGYSGVRWQIVETLLALLERDLIPVIPGQGSVGASGDLAPLAHLAAVLLGLGEAWYRGERVAAADALRRAEIAPLALEAKEGLALLNGTQISTALALRALVDLENVLAAALVAGALTIDAALGSTRPAAMPRSARSPRRCGACWRGARSTPRTPTAGACKIRTRCAASRRCSGRACGRCATRRRSWSTRRTPSATTRWCSPRRTR